MEAFPIRYVVIAAIVGCFFIFGEFAILFLNAHRVLADKHVGLAVKLLILITVIALPVAGRVSSLYFRKDKATADKLKS
jgi:hypothetical protein